MSYDEGSRYLLEEYGMDRNGVTPPKPPTYEELKEKANHLYRKCFLYWQFLADNGLSGEAEEYVCEHIDKEWPFEAFDWDAAQ